MPYNKNAYEKRGYQQRARSKALTRLANLHWNEYRRLYQEEVDKLKPKGENEKRRIQDA